MHRPRHILLVYKKSLYRIYFLDHASTRQPAALPEAARARLLAAHEAHTTALAQVQAVLTERNLAFRSVYRARAVDYAGYDLIIAVGGDGTLIEAARRATHQTVLGVNSDPTRSAGHFCASDATRFATDLDALLAGDRSIRAVNRMQLAIDGEPLSYPAMNDVLVAHRSPAAMSRYTLEVGGESESQRGSGLWISTAAGSTGGIHSAGGRSQPLGSRRLQYLAREPFRENGTPYQLRRGLIPAGDTIGVYSQMREGQIWIDGAHLSLPLGHGSRLTARNHPHPLRLVVK